jgi:hypothetical protein
MFIIVRVGYDDLDEIVDFEDSEKTIHWKTLVIHFPNFLKFLTG